ncbi:hypothetical protein N7448_001255 [Penicillium atrosanguineum]|uniref:uncharacterized protein n=1 Tax=Penicillium atrosanguineum TaxID=1132637 RepID=UPI0023A32173|nr:uncharacterized protein N7443_004654 [Penicillium atrosanguineum]KAJ5149677.1 hypothetical protein N7448_001255 [Penicillium atrosanguineum]KAJ5304994.1 hypothetical protein N7443_004654 [Penicillium atrosanguineum]
MAILPETEMLSANSTASGGIHPSFLEILDKDFIAFYNEHFSDKPVTHTISMAQIRVAGAQFRSPWCRDYSGKSFVKDIQIQSEDGYRFTARCYAPDKEKFGPGPHPIHVNFHGGGFVFGDLTADAQLCLEYRDKAGVLVMDIDYRLAPENAFYKGHEDGWSAVQWVRKNGATINGNTDSISIGGISAGGHICTVIQQYARDACLPLKLAILTVPSTDSHAAYEKPSDSKYTSFPENEFAPWLNWARMSYFRSYASPTDITDVPPLVISPIDGDLNGVCPTMILTAQCDPLRDEGEAYAQKLIKNGVFTLSRRYTGVPHPFTHMKPILKAVMYMDDVCKALKMVHGS